MTSTAPAPFRFTFEHKVCQGARPLNAYIYRTSWLGAVRDKGMKVLLCDINDNWHYHTIEFFSLAQARRDVVFVHGPKGESFPVFIE